MIKQFLPENENRFPHADDVLERYTSDNGFAGGWGMHQKPMPKYWFDNHIHYNGPKDSLIYQNIKPFIDSWEENDTLRALLIVNTYGINRDAKIPAYATDGMFPWFSIEEFKECYGELKDSDNYFWITWIDHREPDPEIVSAAYNAGAKGIKLHNAPVIEANDPFDIWLSGTWQKVFKEIEKKKMPVLFHVTQRLPSSRYTGGGLNSYWKAGWEKGVTYGNEDLLGAFLTCCSLYPDIDFIGAHQLHIGWERLDELFSKYPNLYIDSTVGCTLKLYDDFYPHDKEFLRNIIIKNAERILFGTDAFWGRENFKQINPSLPQHTRFFTSLDLPGDVLNKICHENLERIYKIEPLI